HTGKKLTWDEKFSNLLEFASENGIEIDSACCAGGCGTCQVAILSGDVIYDHPPECDIENGCCLTCVGRPKTDLVLDA
ncbi:MAG: 2Fe-2S iron-sulfur cluster binding domain-containing protein, partial [Pirellulales bacterium]|nr:2Fe-2S iron-sulfur cluster binding domain-containing protein [Pirellulales bacterium]